ncbi:MAG: leucine-rich repeat domain-containing protein [Clostridia bacterium]|nr:leucine-rich repeat domain-containing protein [Clostridia bacterium]
MKKHLLAVFFTLAALIFLSPAARAVDLLGGTVTIAVGKSALLEVSCQDGIEPGTGEWENGSTRHLELTDYNTMITMRGDRSSLGCKVTVKALYEGNPIVVRCTFYDKKGKLRMKDWYIKTVAGDPVTPTPAPTSTPAPTPDYYTYDGDFVYDGTVLVRYRGAAANVTIPAYTTEIAPGVFKYCALNSIHIPEGTTYIGDSCFEGCSALTTVDMPDTVTVIGYRAFAACSSLESIHLPAGLTELSTEVFLDCTSLTSVDIPSGVKRIKLQAFRNCESLSSVTFPSGLVSIGDSAFTNTGLTSVTLPEGLTQLGQSVFNICRRLKSAALPDSLTAMGTNVFKECPALNSVRLPSGLKTLPGYTFYCCTGLKSIQLPVGLEKIGDYAFYGCTALRTVFFPYSVRTVGSYALGGNTGLLRVYFAGESTALGASAMSGCTAMQHVTLPPTVTGINGAAFKDVPVSCVFVTSCQTAVSALTGLGYTVRQVYEAPSPALVSAMMALKVPAGTTEIGIEAFYGGAFQRVILPEGLSVIRPRAFENCDKLLYINIPDSVETIAWDAFRGCTGVFFELPADSRWQEYVTKHGYTFVIR